MKKVTLSVEDEKLKTLLEIIGSLDYVTVCEPDDHLIKLQEKEIAKRNELITSGKMKTRSWEEAEKEIFRKK